MGVGGVKIRSSVSEGAPYSCGGLNGPLPPALRQAQLRILTIANQQIGGGIPSFTSTLQLLALHKNRLTVLPDIHLENNASRPTAILLHNNLLSCFVPLCGNVTLQTSIIAIGNQWRYPEIEFPAWVLEQERDPLLWVSGSEGTSLVQKIISSVSCFMLVVASKLGSVQMLRAISAWQIGPATHLWVVKVAAYLHTYLAMACLLAAAFFMLLLFWDLFACPQTLALLSACSRSSSLIRVLVFLCWCKLSVHSHVVEHVTIQGQNQKKWTTEKSKKTLLLWLLWCGLTAILSTVAILYQVGKSIPGSLQAGKILSLGLKAGVGATQGVVGNFIVPYLASKMTQQKYLFTMVSSLLMSCLIPGAVVIYLDEGCLGRWVAFWNPCRSSRQLFQYRFSCTPENWRDSICVRPTGTTDLHFMVLHSSDICDPHFSWSSTSISKCIHISLLRLQEIWLAKFLTTGVMMPGVAAAT